MWPESQAKGVGSEHGLADGAQEGWRAEWAEHLVRWTGLGVLLWRGDGGCNLIWSHGFSSVSR